MGMCNLSWPATRPTVPAQLARRRVAVRTALIRLPRHRPASTGLATCLLFISILYGMLDGEASAASGYVCPVDDATQAFVISVVVAPDDVPADHAGLFLVAGVVGAVHLVIPTSDRNPARIRPTCVLEAERGRDVASYLIAGPKDPPVRITGARPGTARGDQSPHARRPRYRK